MASFQLDKLTAKELTELDTKLKKAIVAAKEREKSAIKQKLDAIVAEAGLTFDEIAELYGFGRNRGSLKGTKVAPKYRNPDNRLETWTGRGRQPRWLSTKLGKGSKLTDFAI